MPLPVKAEEFLRGQGLDPAEYEIDPQSNDLVHVGGLGGRAWTAAKDFGKSAARTLLSMPGDTLQAAPAMLDLPREINRLSDFLGVPPEKEGGRFFKKRKPLTEDAYRELPATKLGETLSKAADIVPPVSGTSPITSTVGATAGALLPMLTGVGTATAAPRLGALLKTLGYVGGAGQQAKQVIDRNLAHQKELAPEQPANVEEAGNRALAAAAIDVALGKLVGQGSLARALEGPAASIGKRFATQAGAGAVEGAGSAASQDLLSEGKITRENVGLGALAGGLAQGGIAAVAGKGHAGPTKTAEEAAKGFGESTPEKTPVAAVKPVFTPEEMSIILDPTKEFDPPKKFRRPQDELIIDAKKAGLLRTEEDVNALLSAEDPVVAGRELYAKRAAEKPSFEQPPADETAVKAEAAAKASEKFQKDLEALEKQRATFEKEIEVMEKNPAFGAGDKVLAKWKTRQEIERVDERIRKLFADHNATRMASAVDDPRVRISQGTPVGPLSSGMPPRPPSIGEGEVAIQRSPVAPPRPDISPALQRVLAEEAAAALQGAPLRGLQDQPLVPAKAVADSLRLADLEQRRAAANAERQKAAWLSGEDLPGGRAYSGIPPEILTPLRDLLNLEDENRVPFGRVRSGSVERPPMPERAETLQEQAKLVADPRSPKKAMLVTGVAVSAPKGMATEKTRHGEVIYNPAKVNREEVVAAGSGETFDGRLLGYNETLPAGDTVVTTAVNGVPDVVTEVTAADKVPAVVEGQQTLTGGKGETTVTTPEEVAEMRRTPVAYSTLFGLTPEDMPRLKRFLKPEQMHAGFGLSAVAELNRERPFGMDRMKSGNLPVNGIRARMAATIPKTELDIYNAAGLDAWLGEQGGTINTDKLAAWMFANGPRMEVKPLFAASSNDSPEFLSAQRRLAELTHKLDTMLPGWENIAWKHFPDDYKEMYNEVRPLQAKVDRMKREATEANNSATSRFTIVNPKPLDEMPGAVDILVRVPISAEEQMARRDLHGRGKETLYEGHHFLDEDINILGWTRGYMETLPTGEKVFHVFEVQSDWAQRVRKEEAKQNEFTPKHPLLPESNRLALKAAIRHAIDNGADYIAVSDAETAMLTEGHDHLPQTVIEATKENADRLASVESERHPDVKKLRSGKTINITGNALDIIDEVRKLGLTTKTSLAQEPGMRLNYDQVLPKILEQLTGYKPSKVSFGEHNNAVRKKSERIPGTDTESSDSPFDTSEWRSYSVPRENLFFKNPDGTPKTDITARVYSLNKVRPALEETGGFTMFGKDAVDRGAAYSTLFGLTPEDFKSFRRMLKEPWNAIPRAIHAMTASATDKMAARDPLLAAASERYAVMDRDSRRLAERKAVETEKFEKFLKDKDVIEWLHRSTDGQTDDVSSLPAKWQPLAAEWIDHRKSYHREQIARKVNVRDADGKWRKPIDRAGYFPWAMSADVHERLQTGTPEEKARLEDIWVKNWKHFVPKATKDDALAALAEYRGELARVQVNQGQPLFSAVVREYGVPIPREFRATPAESIDRYNSRWAKHMMWAQYAQNDPLMRRAFGITQNSLGEDTTAIDAKHRMTNADWQDAFRAGQKVDASWTWDATPQKYKTTSAEGSALSNQDPIAQDILASYTGRSREAGGRLFNSIQRLTSPIVMGHASKLRDITQSGSTVAEYVPSVVKMAEDVARASADLRGAAKEARAAGFLERDPFAHEGFNDLSTTYGPLNYLAKGVKVAAEGIRTYSGMKHMDIASKILAFEPARAAVERQIAVLGKDKSPLVKEFGPPPSQLAELSDKDVIQLTANKIADVVTPRYSAENVPHRFLPQNKDALGMMFRLMTWSIARYNNWYKHNWLAATKQQRPMRLVKSLFYSALGGAATATLLEMLRDKKPAKLTMTEWLGLDDDTKWRELVPLVGGYIDAQGSLGVLGWAANKGIMMGYGRPAATADLDPMIPALIAGRQLSDTLFSFFSHWNEKGWDKLDAHDLGILSLELASIPQTGRDIVSRLGLDDRKESRDVNREVKVFEQITGRSAKTGAPVKPQGFFFDRFRRNPYALSKEVNEAKTLDELIRLAPQLQAQAAAGFELPAIQGDEKIPAFYQDVARRRGVETARKIAFRDLEEAQRDAAKRSLLGR